MSAQLVRVQSHRRLPHNELALPLSKRRLRSTMKYVSGRIDWSKRADYCERHQVETA